MNRANAAWINGAPAYTTGLVGSAWNFAAGGMSLVESPTQPGFNLASGTVEGWVNLTSSLGGRFFDRISAGGTDGFLLDTTNGLRVIAGTRVAQGSATTVLPLNQWVHIAGTWSNTGAAVYIDGVDVTATSAGSSSAFSSTLPLRLGNSQNGLARIQGAMDELGIYSRALTGAEIGQLFSRGAQGRCFETVTVPVNVTGLPSGETVTLRSKGVDTVVAGNGVSQLSPPLVAESMFSLTVTATSSPSIRCNVPTATGTATAGMTPVAVVCVHARTLPASLNATGMATGNGRSFRSSVDNSGRYVVFLSAASDLVSGDTNGRVDAFLRDMDLQTTVRVNVGDAQEATGAPGVDAVISGDGRSVIYTTMTTFDGGAANRWQTSPDIVAFDRVTGTRTRLVDVPPGVTVNAMMVSSDGRYVAFTGAGNTNLFPGHANIGTFRPYVFDRETGTLRVVGRNTSGSPYFGGPNDHTPLETFSSNGRYLSTRSIGFIEVEPIPGNCQTSYSWDWADWPYASRRTLPDNGSAPTCAPSTPSNGNTFFDDFGSSWFTAWASPITNVASSVGQVYRRQAPFRPPMAFSGTSTLLSVAAGTTLPANGDTFLTSLSSDGLVGTFLSRATNLVTQPDSNGNVLDCFVRQSDGGIVRLNEARSGGGCDSTSLSRNGQWVVFESVETLSATDTNTVTDIYLRRVDGPVFAAPALTSATAAFDGGIVLNVALGGGATHALVRAPNSPFTNWFDPAQPNQPRLAPHLYGWADGGALEVRACNTTDCSAPTSIPLTQADSRNVGRTIPGADGDDVALSLDGLWLASGAPNRPGGGAVDIYRRQSDGSFGFFQTLTTTGGTNFGFRVAFESFGFVLVVADNAYSSFTGRVHVFTRGAGNFNQVTTILGATGSALGGSLALSKDGTVLAVSSGASPRGVRTFRAPTWAQQDSMSVPGTNLVNGGLAIDATGLTLAVGMWDAAATSSGSAYVYSRSDPSMPWGSPTTLLSDAQTSGGGGSRFGSTVAMNARGDRVAIGGYQHNSEDGAAWVYSRSSLTSSTWTQTGFLAPPAGSSMRFGYSLAFNVEGDLLAVGAIRERGNAAGLDGTRNTPIGLSGGDQGSAGAVFLYRPSSTGWTELRYLKPPRVGPTGPEHMGWSVSLDSSGETIAIGAPLPRRVYVY